MAVTTVPTARRESDALAGLASRLVSALAGVLALWLLSEVVGLPEILWWPLAAWGVGFALSFALPQTRSLFASVSGTIVGLSVVAFLAVTYVALAAVAQTPLDLPPHVFLLALVPLGLDWHLVVRLRARVLSSGFVVIVLVGLDGSGRWATSGDGGALLVAMAWFAVALAALWLLHRDQIGALPRPAPLGGQPAGTPPLAPGDFLLIALVSAVIAVVIALLVAGPSCLPWEACARGDQEFDPSGLPGGLPNPGEWGDPGEWGNPSSGSTGGGGPGTAAGAGYFYDQDGRAYAYDPGTDSYLRVPRGDAYGFDPGSGYHYDGDGNAYTYDGEQDRYRRAPGGDALVPDPDGEYFFKDREGEYWIPSENGKPIPPDAEITDGMLLDPVVIDGVIVEGGEPYQMLPPDVVVPDPGASGGLPDDPSTGEGIDWGRFLLVLGGLLLLGGLVALAIWYWRRESEEPPELVEPVGVPERPWAEAMVRRLTDVGTRHGRARGAGESIEAYATDGVAPAVGDRRLAKVGLVLSGALFGSGDTPPDHRAWVEGVLDQIDVADAAALADAAAGGRQPVRT